MPVFGSFRSKFNVVNKNNRVLLSQALCVIGSLGNLKFKLNICAEHQISSGNLSQDSVFVRRTHCLNTQCLNTAVHTGEVLSNSFHLNSRQHLGFNAQTSQTQIYPIKCYIARGFGCFWRKRFRSRRSATAYQVYLVEIKYVCIKYKNVQQKSFAIT